MCAPDALFAFRASDSVPGHDGIRNLLGRDMILAASKGSCSKPQECPDPPHFLFLICLVIRRRLLEIIHWQDFCIPGAADHVV